MWETLNRSTVCVMLAHDEELETALIYIYDKISNMEVCSVACDFHTTTTIDI
jgi:hypothetical protein